LKALNKTPSKAQTLETTVIKYAYLLHKNKGKSGGARVITNFVIADETVYLLSIYDKSEKENLTEKEIKELLQFVPE